MNKEDVCMEWSEVVDEVVREGEPDIETFHVIAHNTVNEMYYAVGEVRVDPDHREIILEFEDVLN